MKTWIRALFGLNALLWGVFAWEILPHGNASSISPRILASFMLANATAMLVIGLLTLRGGRLWSVAAIGFLIALILIDRRRGTA